MYPTAPIVPSTYVALVPNDSVGSYGSAVSTARVSADAAHVHDPEKVSTRFKSTLSSETVDVTRVQAQPFAPEEYSATRAPPTHPVRCVPDAHHRLVTSLAAMPIAGELMTSSVPS